LGETVECGADEVSDRDTRFGYFELAATRRPLTRFADPKAFEAFSRLEL